MKKAYKLLVVSILLFCFTLRVNAECLADEINKLSEQANSIINQVELYDVSESDDTSSLGETYPSFLISFYNMNSNLQLVQKGGSFRSTASMIKDGRITFRYRSLTYHTETYEVYANSSTCSGKLLRSMTVTIPKYNEFSSNPICDTIPDYIYCSKTLNSSVEISYKQFIDGSSKYQADLESSSSLVIVEQTRYLILAIIINVVLIGGLGYLVYIIIKKVKKNKEINKRGIV